MTDRARKTGVNQGEAPSASTETFTMDGAVLAAPVLQPGLYVVATPIGNLADITLRALRTLAAADTVLCEDTRVTSRLMARYGMKTPLKPYHDHNAAKVRPRILDDLEAGAAIALVSDAGTPLVSDPGYRLVADAVARGVPVTPLPGPSALLAALAAAGLPTDRFQFAGFLSARQGQRRRELEALAGVDATLVFYESPRRLADALADMSALLGDRAAVVARELTKLHEEFARGSLTDLAARYAGDGAPRGEIVIAVGPPAAPEPPGADELDALVLDALKTESVRGAADLVSRKTGLPRREVYARAVALKDKGATGPD